MRWAVGAIAGTYRILDPFPWIATVIGFAAADVCDVEVAELLDAGGAVVGQGEQDGVSDTRALAVRGSASDAFTSSRYGARD